MSARGYPVPEIARIFECQEATVREWLARFEAHGIGGLTDRPHSGRPARAGAAARERLGRMDAAGPASVGYAGCIWTTLTLGLALRLTEQLAVSAGVCLFTPAGIWVFFYTLAPPLARPAHRSRRATDDGHPAHPALAGECRCGGALSRWMRCALAAGLARHRHVDAPRPASPRNDARDQSEARHLWRLGLGDRGVALHGDGPETGRRLRGLPRLPRGSLSVRPALPGAR